MTSIKSFEAMKGPIGTKAAAVAKRLGLSPSTVYKWTESSECPTDSGNRNPVDVIEQTIEIGLAFSVARDEALLPVMYLEERFNRVGVDLPEAMPSAQDLLQELARTIKEFGDLAEVTSEALRTEGVDRRENEKIQREGWQLVRQALTLMKLAEIQAAGKKR